MEDQQLPIPQAARHDPASMELLRVWMSNKGQVVVLRPGVWKDPAAWGLVLGDLMRHVADAYQKGQGLDPMKTLQRIKAGFDAEWKSPSDHPTGRIV